MPGRAGVRFPGALSSDWTNPLADTSTLVACLHLAHDLVEGILEELEGVQPGSALEIPLADVNGIGLANLRSAVHRASNSSGMEIKTLADEKNFYVWKTVGNNGSNGS
jgi:hypothetical protein